MNEEISLADLLAAENSAELIKTLPFEKGLSLLENLVSQVESGRLSLEQAICSYERGVALLAHLRIQLEGAEKRLQVLQLQEKEEGA